MKTAYFDMDGTIANFYGVDNWLEYLANHDTFPYRNAPPIFSSFEINTLIQSLREKGYNIGIISWCSKENHKAFNAEIRKAKKAWLKEFFPFADEIHIVAYGVPKWSLVKPNERQDSILFDDEAQNLEAWEKHGGKSVNAKDILKLIYEVENE